MRLAGVAIVAIVVIGTTARADVDWAKGVVTARGIGIADRYAPTPATAREPARRAAEAAARKQLAAQLPKLPFANGSTVGKRLGKAVDRELEATIAAAFVVDATPHTDGSWTVTLAVPIEAVRQVILGRRSIRADDRDAPVVVVDGVTAKPAVGYSINDVAGATVWVKAIPEWAKDAPRLSAKKGATAGKIVAPPKAPGDVKGGAATLFVLVTPRS